MTGAGGGIGRATARAFLAAGWNVGLVGRKPSPCRKRLEIVMPHWFFPVDVTDEKATEQMVAKAAAKWGRVDVLFNNAGVSMKGAPVDELDLADIRNLTEVNVMGCFYRCPCRIPPNAKSGADGRPYYQ
ncbi:MAG: SDR family oxidoreductase [Porticoccaceae bacterium]